MMFLKNFSQQLCLNHMCKKISPKAERMKKMIQDLAAGKSYELGPTSVKPAVEGAVFFHQADVPCDVSCDW